MSEILVVEDDAAVRSLLVFLLRRSGYSAIEAACGGEAQQAVTANVPSLVLLDRMLPDMDGLEVLRDWRRQPQTMELPVIMLTARAEEDDRVDGLSGGADDYVTKPFSRAELLLRIEKLIKRSGNGSGRPREVLQIDGLRIDRSGARVALDNEIVRLGTIEFRLLDLLASNADRVHTRGEIIDKVWTRGGYVDPRTVDVHVRRLRKVLERAGYDRFIQTVRGIGYRFSSESA
ncbi:MAG TPA: response regulator [Gammaproteobacteria bacterium]|nr:response regulator [Gammaproteobacteria bacterium]